MNFNIYYTYDVALCEDWPSFYTLDRSQDSDNGEFVWAVGQHDVEPYKSFATSAEMFEWCYSNGWSEPDDDI